MYITLSWLSRWVRQDEMLGWGPEVRIFLLQIRAWHLHLGDGGKIMHDGQNLNKSFWLVSLWPDTLERELKNKHPTEKMRISAEVKRNIYQWDHRFSVITFTFSMLWLSCAFFYLLSTNQPGLLNNVLGCFFKASLRFTGWSWCLIRCLGNYCMSEWKKLVEWYTSQQAMFE